MSDFYCMLDLPKCLAMVKELNNLCERETVTALITIFESRKGKNAALRNNLEALINSRISAGKVILPDRNNQLYGVQIKNNNNYNSVAKNEKLKQSIDATIATAVLNNASNNRLSMGITENNSIIVSTDLIDESNRHVIHTDIKGLQRTLEVINTTCRIYSNQWVNIAFKQLYQGNDFGVNTPEVLTLLKKLAPYYVQRLGCLTLGLNFAFSNFSNMFKPASTVTIKSTFASGSFQIIINYDLMPDVLKSFADEINGNIIKCIFEYSALETLESEHWTEKLSSITFLYPMVGKKRDYERLALGVAIYGSNLLFDKSSIRTYMDYYSDSLVCQVSNLIRKYRFIAIAASKGSGKSNLMRSIPKSYLCIDSDVRGRFYKALYSTGLSHVLDSVKNKNFSDPAVLGLLYSIVIDESTFPSSIYEELAEFYVNENKLTEKIVCNYNACLKHYRNFSTICKNVNALTDSTSAGFINTCNLLIEYAATYHGVNYSKIVHFFHNSSDLYGAMTPAIFSMTVNINTTPIHLVRQRDTSPIVQLFLSGYYIFYDTFSATKVNLFELERAFSGLSNEDSLVMG